MTWFRHIRSQPQVVFALWSWQAGCKLSLKGWLALESTVQHPLILYRKRHGDTQLPVLLHGALDGLIGVGVSRPAATSHLQHTETGGSRSALSCDLSTEAKLLSTLSPHWRHPSWASDWPALLLPQSHPTANQTLHLLPRPYGGKDKGKVVNTPTWWPSN